MCCCCRCVPVRPECWKLFVCHPHGQANSSNCNSHVKMLSKLSTEIRLIIYIAGLYGSFVYWGFLQEKLTSTEYVLDNNQGGKYRWHFPFALNVFMALATFVVASIGDAMSPHRANVPLLAFAKPAISCAMVGLCSFTIFLSNCLHRLPQLVTKHLILLVFP